MKSTRFVTSLWLLFLLMPAGIECNGPSTQGAKRGETIFLPEPARVGEMTLEEALGLRRAVRDYSNEPLTLEELGQLLWAGQGITSDDGRRTAPSAGALYPLEMYVVTGNVEGMSPGVYRYASRGHTLTMMREGDFRQPLFEEAISQTQIVHAAVNIVIAAVYDRTSLKYGERGRRYVHMEVGHAGQNICLQAQTLNLGVCPIGAFEDEGVKRVLDLPEKQDPLYILSVGKAR